ncbi:hypothetical protein SERLA73DRAFT_54832 [Serpula lacrymans var. lacrymans S7.3]|uniref:Arrestin-like N-terminal domain-containing protein n=1 Tax=Serpula lacrymans var. lacrymans (strain S7.3) TaxID=936435 RepID=F8PY51_SERL3|nr:hypothetical protein SERLA73DRAFT_54832 [Serpula lacrymans var. lacrymans S7.3]
MGDQDSELPEYSAPLSEPVQGGAQGPVNGRSEHTYSLENSKGQKWLFLVVKSRSRDSLSLPTYYAGDVISGRTEINVIKSESIKAVTISVTAGTTSVGQEEQLFLKIENELWNPNMILPDGTKVSKFSKGIYSWPFEVTLPTETEVQDGTAKKKFPLPPTFSERASPAYIDYKLFVTIKRGALRVNQTLSTSFGYNIITRADPPSSLRQLAYREGSPLIGPKGDPEGWKVLPPVSIKGTFFGSKDAVVDCTLAIATPLTYARASPLPLTITLTSEDNHALDLLSSPSSIQLLLVRSMATGSDATSEDISRRSNNFFLENVARAVFWPSSEGSKEDGRRVLSGEVDIKNIFKPSFMFPRFTVRVCFSLR